MLRGQHIRMLFRHPISRLDHDDFPLDFAGDHGTVRGHVDVDLGPHAELWQVDAGLDSDPDAFDHCAGVFRFPPVEVDAVGVDLAAEAVDEVVGVSGFRDDQSGRGVDKLNSPIHANRARTNRRSLNGETNHFKKSRV